MKRMIYILAVVMAVGCHRSMAPGLVTVTNKMSPCMSEHVACPALQLLPQCISFLFTIRFIPA